MNIHFLGIGGTAMGSVAIACAELGHRVTGSDANVYPPMSDVLSKSGINWYEGYNEQKLVNCSAEVFVVGNALSRGNPELEYVLRNRLNMTSMAELVGRLLIDKNSSIVVSGTHGKTTTTSITAWILEHAGFQPGFMIGGVPRNFPVGCRAVPPAANNTRAGVFVSEGDEYDTAFFDKRSKFVHYRPTVAIVNNIEFDHADIFPDIQAIITSFKHMIRLVPDDGVVLVNADDANALDACANCPCERQTIGFALDSYWKISDMHQSLRTMTFTVTRNNEHYGNFSFDMPGEHSVRNVAMALAATSFIGVTPEEQQRALAAYAPPKRRLEEIGTWRGAVVIDDFAHHPTAILATVSAVSTMYPNVSIHAVFEPRSNTTTRNFFQKELEECFIGAASVCIGPVNRPDRYAESERLNVEQLTQKLNALNISTFAINSSLAETPWGSAVAERLEAIVKPNDVVLLLSNGDIGGFRKLVTN